MKHQIVSLLLLCLLTACTEFKDENSGDHGKISAQRMDEFIQTRVAPNEEPKRYSIYFDWPQLTDDKKVRIRQGREIALVDSNQTHFTSVVDHNNNYTYTFEILNNDESVEKAFHLLVKVPEDLVFSGNMYTGSDSELTYQRIFLNQQTLFTVGDRIILNTEELIVQDGNIETFRSDSKAPMDEDGKSGGELTINAKVARGNLKIIMRGQNGGDGSTGGTPSGRGASGTPATTGAWECGGGCFCRVPGAPGGDGQKGAPGFRGNPAKNGGDTGDLKINIDDGRAFTLDVERIPGLPGTPGAGGAGQLGGLGGTHDFKPCKGQDGNEGPRGDQGPLGNAGASGKNSQYCIYIKSEARNECID